jgi:hypothetical protein
MRDPLYIEPQEWRSEIPEAQRVHYEKVKLTNEALQKGLNEAHDRIRRLTSTNNSQASKLQAATRRLDLAGVKLWILSGIVLGQTTVLGWLVKVFLDRIK